MTETTRKNPRIVAAAERQMRERELAHRIADRLVRRDPGHTPGRKVGPYIAISREAGAGGEELAQLLGDKLNWEVLDKKLVDRIAEQFRLSRSMLKLVDETKASWVHDVLGAWVDPKLISHEKYVVELGRIVVEAAHRGNVILVGRGAQFILPPDCGVAVRLIASEKYRIRRMAVLLDTTPEQAKRCIVETDDARREFVRRFFHRDIADPHLYDLVINVERLGLSDAAELIVEVCRQRGFSPAE